MISTFEKPTFADRTTSEEKTLKVGTVLKNAREKMNLSENEAASRLHLKPRIIKALESEQFDGSLPPIFIRGYLRSYAKLLNLSEGQIIQLTTHLNLKTPPTPQLFNTNIMPEQSYFGWVIFSAIALAVILGGIWWSKHSDESFVNNFSPTHALSSLESIKNSIMEPTKLADELTAPTIENASPSVKIFNHLNLSAISQAMDSVQFNPNLSDNDNDD